MPPQLRAEQVTDPELDRLAEVSASDVQAASLAWRRDAPDPYKRLLDAEVVADDDER